MIYFIQPLIYAWIYLLILILILPISIIALPLSQNNKVKFTAPFWNLLFKITVRTIFASKLYIEDRRDEESQQKLSPQGLYISNHKSFVDIPLMFRVLIIPPIMKKEVVYIPIFGICAYSAGGILVDRKDKNSRKQVLEESKKRLKYGRRQLQYYPEGTRQQGNKPILPVEKIKTPLIEFAFQEKIPVYPVSMEGTQYCMKNAIIYPFKPLGMILHEKVDPTNFKSEDEFVKVCWNKVINGKKELEQKIYL